MAAGTLARGVALLPLCMLLADGPRSGGAPLKVQVTPAVTRAPGYLIIRVSVEADDENRSLLVQAESAGFYRSGEVQLDGRRGAPMNVFGFRDLPTGLYQVTAVLTGVHGRRATATGLARVVSSGPR